MTFLLLFVQNNLIDIYQAPTTPACMGPLLRGQQVHITAQPTAPSHLTNEIL